jgi:hypothetical protein
MTVKELILELQKYPENCEVNMQYEAFSFLGVGKVFSQPVQQNGGTVVAVILQEED